MNSDFGSRGDKRDDFLTRVSHELRTPLTSIIGFAEAMLSDHRLPTETRRRYAAMIRDAGKRLSSFLDDYLDLAYEERLEARAEKPKENVWTLVQWAIDLASREAENKGVTVRAGENRPTCYTACSVFQVVLVIENVLTNCIRFCESGGVVEVETLHNEHDAEVCIRVPHVTLTGDLIEHAAREFTWIPTPGLAFRENGLGLAFAKHVIQLEGGDLMLRSENGGGVSFTIRIPARHLSSAHIIS